VRSRDLGCRIEDAGLLDGLEVCRQDTIYYPEERQAPRLSIRWWTALVKARPDYVENAAPCPGGPRDTRHINCHSWMALVKAADHTPLSRPIKSQPLSIKNQSSTIHKPKPHTQHQQQISPQFPTTSSS